MLYDPKWEAKVEPLSLTGLIAWLELQPTDKSYCYLDHGQCLVGSYLTHCGYVDPYVFSVPSYFKHNGSDTTDYPEEFNRIALYWPHTFGAALERARAFNK